MNSRSSVAHADDSQVEESIEMTDRSQARLVVDSDDEDQLIGK